jgi:hypothetical protein
MRSIRVKELIEMFCSGLISFKDMHITVNACIVFDVITAV